MKLKFLRFISSIKTIEYFGLQIKGTQHSKTKMVVVRTRFLYTAINANYLSSVTNDT